ncbi:hypothetical protein sscle_04g039680 [Sclerotinia sclerotiorum 1980 UF-70]|uniref:CBM1 domain-containing protein n=1 Tax=Sclerotinia sclerotiorum (strain ATCC 18683 / 1980 / Ss-1) TaxID=665079 RepID=A0A1D9Q2M0_SCLS1|nr:hypothetical protein sscle_04g039680 [Sclerotinia sclerotiorum 1980 UF-70]
MIFPILLFVATTAAQQAAYGQCGGVSWTGATSCATGSTCVYQNQYYSQCLPGADSSTSSSKTTSILPATSKVSTLTSKVSSTSTSIAKSPTSTAGIEYFITFGDSYSQTGFDPTLTQPAAGNPLGNPNLQGFTTTGGLNWIGYLVETYNVTLMLSYNFAFGGATTNASLVAPYAPTVLSLIDQVDQFVQYIPSGPWSASNTLFGIFMGVNDVGNAYYLSNYTTVLGQIMDSYFAEVQRLYDAGGRNFLFLTVPPTQDSPLFIAQGTAVQASLATAISQYNAALVSRVTEFKVANAGSKTWVYDTQIPFLAAINNPTAYGSANATCINSDGVSCLWWNNYHPGQIIHKLVAQGVATLMKGTFW